MPTLIQTKLALMTAIAAIVCTGCQQAEIIFHRHQPLTMAAQTPSQAPRAQADTAVLARFQESEEPTAGQEPSSTQPSGRLDPVSAAAGLMAGPALQSPESPATQPSAPTATQPSASEPSYTSPGVAIRYAPLSVGMASAAIGVPDAVGGGREAGEAQVLSSTALLTGAPGLAAPSPTVQGTAGGAQGLVEGPAPGIGRAGPNNFFNRQINPASGPDGRRAELIRAGFTPDRIPGGQRSRHR